MKLRHLWLISLWCWASGGQGAVSSILSCLGQEELKIHQAKTTGPVYYLNQYFINAMATNNKVQLKQDYLQKICADRDFSPSVNFLFYYLLEGREIFDLATIHKSQDAKEAYELSALSSFANEIPHIFFNYLSQLQGLVQRPDCLSQQIPEVGFFLEQFRVLEEDLPPGQLMEDKVKIKKIFSKLKQFDRILEICNRSTEKEEKNKK